jgi:hypothetical protein
MARGNPTRSALLFVFGYLATKMRQAKLSELIHNSARYPDLQDCSVEVHFREIIDEVCRWSIVLCNFPLIVTTVRLGRI